MSSIRVDSEMAMLINVITSSLNVLFAVKEYFLKWVNYVNSSVALIRTISSHLKYYGSVN